MQVLIDIGSVLCRVLNAMTLEDDAVIQRETTNAIL